MTIYQKLAEIQSTMKAPKNLYNKFGKYNYRNAEGILEAFKPYGVKHKVMLLVTDEIRMVGDRFYVRAEAKLIDLESETSISAFGFAREAESKAGMDEAQITGSASSYARKYALNGLLLLDDTKDPDTDEYHERTHPQQKKMPQKAPQSPRLAGDGLQRFTNDLMQAGASIEKVCQKYKVNSLSEMTVDQAEECITIIRGQ